MNLRQNVLDQDICALAFPKGKQPVCSMCKTKARYICNKCKEVFYCSEKHRDDDLRLIHHAVCPIIQSIKQQDNGLVQDKETRAMYKKQIEIKELEIIQICMTRAHRSLLLEGANDAVHQLRVASKYASQPIDKCRVALLLAEALNDAGLDRVTDAKVKLAEVSWFLKDPEFGDNPEMCADFHMNEGFCYASVEDYDSAILSFSNEIFYASTAYHEEHSRTASGYYHLGHTFLLRGQVVNASSLFLHAIEIWTSRLFGIFNQITNRDILEKIFYKVPFKDSLSVRDERMCGVCLDNIYTEMRRESWLPDPTDILRVLNAMALFYFVLDSFEEAETYIADMTSIPESETSSEVLSCSQRIAQRCADALTIKTHKVNSKKVTFRPGNPLHSSEAMYWYRLKKLSPSTSNDHLKTMHGMRSSNSPLSSIELSEIDTTSASTTHSRNSQDVSSTVSKYRSKVHRNTL